MVLHDLQRVVRASRGGPINSAVMAQLAEEAGDLDRARVQVGRQSMPDTLLL